MTPTDIIKLEIELLIAKHGRQRVIEALARAEDIPLAELETRIRAAKGLRAPRNRPTRLTAADVLRQHNLEPSPRTSKINELAHRFDNKRLFPTLREVVAFLSSVGESKPPKKSRPDAATALVRVLMSMPEVALDRLLDDTDPARRSDYFELAHEIMGRPAKRP